MINLSIIIPCFNAEATIGVLLKQILNRSEKDFEVIIVDDGSTDATFSICTNIKDERVRVVSVENGGVSRARNIGLKNSTGKYIMFVDSDDMLTLDWYKVVKNGIRKDCDVVIFSNHIGQKANNNNELIEKLFVQKDGVCYYRLVTSKIYKKSFLHSKKIEFNELLINGEDLLFNIEAYSNCANFAEANDSIYLYNLNQQSLTHKFDDRIFDNQKRLLNAISQNRFSEKYRSIYAAETVCMLCRRLAYVNYKDSKKRYSKIKDFLSIGANKKAKIFGCLLKNNFLYILYLITKIENKIKDKRRIIEV